jgi:hypothetical protein
MTDRPQALRLVDNYFAAARIAHEYIFDLDRELAELDAGDDHTRELVHESASVVLERMPGLARRLRGLEREWSRAKSCWIRSPPSAPRSV